MRLFLLTIALILAQDLRAELVPSPTPTPIPTPTMPVYPACENPPEYEVYRCGCRIDLAQTRGGVSSTPLLMNGQIVIFSATNISGETCRGTFRPDACTPALSGMEAKGTYSCALVRVRGSDITVR